MRVSSQLTEACWELHIITPTQLNSAGAIFALFSFGGFQQFLEDYLYRSAALLCWTQRISRPTHCMRTFICYFNFIQNQLGQFYLADLPSYNTSSPLSYFFSSEVLLDLDLTYTHHLYFSFLLDLVFWTEVTRYAQYWRWGCSTRWYNSNVC